MIDVLSNVITFYKSAYSKNVEVQEKLIQITFMLSTIKEKRNEVDRETIQDVALNYVSNMGVMFPKKKAYPIFKQYLEKMFNSSDLNQIEAAFLILGRLSEGCSEYIKRDLIDPIINVYIKNGIEAENSQIRNACFGCINFFAQYINPEIFIHHDLILPALIKHLEDLNAESLEETLKTIEIFCEEIEDANKVIDYLPQMIPKLFAVLESNETSIDSKKHAILAIASCAEAADAKFEQYAIDLVPLITQLLKLEGTILEFFHNNVIDTAMLGVRAVATHCLGVMLGSCLKQNLRNNKEFYQKHIEPSIGLIYNGMKTIDHATLKEYSFSFFYQLANCLEEDFKPYLKEIFDFGVQTIETTVAIQKQEKQKNNLLSMDSDSEDDEMYADRDVLEEIAAIIHCFGEMALALPKDYEPYYENTVKLIEEFESHFYAGIKVQVLVCLKNLTKALVKLQGNGTFPTYERGLPATKKLADEVEYFIKNVFLPKYINTSLFMKQSYSQNR